MIASQRILLCGGRVLALAVLMPAVLAPAIAGVSTASAAILYESGTLGPTGVPRSEIANENVAGTNISPAVFTGVRFFVGQPVVTTQIGGHFVRNNGAGDSFFGAIVRLEDSNDFPDSGTLSTPDVVGATLLSFPEPSDEVFGDLFKTLSPGWYALVFGSGLFGASGSGVAVRNGADIDDPPYIAFQPASAFGWVSLSTFPNHRFVVEGRVVPEPSAAILFVMVISITAMHRGCVRQ